MSALFVSVAVIDESTGEESAAGDPVFAPFDSAAVAVDPGLGMPQWQPLHVPSESLEMFAAFQADSDHVSLQVRSGACNVAALMCASPSMLKFLTPSGVSVVLSMYRDGQ